VILDEVAAFLVAQGLGVLNVDLFAGKLPNDPNACCAVYEYPGMPGEFGFGAPGGVIHETPGIQVVFRGEPHDYVGPRVKAQAAYLALSKVQAEPLSGTFYHWIHPQHTPTPLGPGPEGRDGLDRIVVKCSYLCEKEPSAA
jgi:hypothetical protein